MVRPLGEIDISKNNLRRVDSLSTLREEALHMHKVHQGKLETVSKVKVENAKDLSLAYSPGLQNLVRKFMTIKVRYMNIQ